jgi:hypothetical protein
MKGETSVRIAAEEGVDQRGLHAPLITPPGDYQNARKNQPFATADIGLGRVPR